MSIVIFNDFASLPETTPAWKLLTRIIHTQVYFFT
jgi:hypothetical protein